MIQHAGLAYRHHLAGRLSPRFPKTARYALSKPHRKTGWKWAAGRANSLTVWRNGCHWRCTDCLCRWARQAPLDTDLIDGIKEMMRRYDCTLFSDHLSYCHDGGHLYDLLPLPFTEEMVHHTARRIREVQDRLGCRIAMENTSYYLHSPLAEMNEVEFSTPSHVRMIAAFIWMWTISKSTPSITACCRRRLFEKRWRRSRVLNP